MIALTYSEAFYQKLTTRMWRGNSSNIVSMMSKNCVAEISSEVNQLAWAHANQAGTHCPKSPGWSCCESSLHCGLLRSRRLCSVLIWPWSLEGCWAWFRCPQARSKQTGNSINRKHSEQQLAVTLTIRCPYLFYTLYIYSTIQQLREIVGKERTNVWRTLCLS